MKVSRANFKFEPFCYRFHNGWIHSVYFCFSCAFFNWKIYWFIYFLPGVFCYWYFFKFGWRLLEQVLEEKITTPTVLNLKKL